MKVEDRQRWTQRVSFIVFIGYLFSGALIASEPCSTHERTIGGLAAEIKRLEAKQAELASKYESAVKAQMDAQSDGLLDEIQRNTALKILYAKKRLAQSLSYKKVLAARLTQSYCKRCAPKGKAPATPPQFCTLCPAGPTCH